MMASTTTNVLSLISIVSVAVSPSGLFGKIDDRIAKPHRVVYRWRKPLFDGKDTRVRHRLQAPAPGIPGAGRNAAGLLLHRRRRGSGVFLDPSAGRLARL